MIYHLHSITHHLGYVQLSDKYWSICDEMQLDKQNKDQLIVEFRC